MTGQFSVMPTKDPQLHLRLFMELETFYNGLNAHTRLMVDSSANVALLSKFYNEAYRSLIGSPVTNINGQQIEQLQEYE
ncbi:hypothetical protein PVK06_047450 [Gossypium arboreum]|uniref:Uncharacterized protein n=1 Tax=Gossypium arboreum TaxID=29729 RepID=A0ABR0MFB4_GOSAR|nr:hypothetical protein PVK06_047450 [Gossypium arboreum]